MKFLCLICADAGRMMEHLTPAEAARHFDDYADFTRAIRASGHLVGLNRLQPPETAATVRVRDGEVAVTDGPYVETKEQLGGYYVIEARDRDEAIGIAARIPGAWIGCVEVRPIAEDTTTLAALGLTSGAPAR